MGNIQKGLSDFGSSSQKEAPLAEPVKVAATKALAKATVPKVGRNELCPCGSGKKYKKCHGA
jgi:preprotein translocase subunit SecA